MRSPVVAALALSFVTACSDCHDGSQGSPDGGSLDTGAGDLGAGDLGSGDLGSNDLGSNDLGTDSGTDAGMVTCPSAPPGATAQQIVALDTVNATRRAMGVPCTAMVAAVNQSATAHCSYYATNQGTASCFVMGNSHSEVSGCSGFTGANFSTRMTAAGYVGQARFEDMAFSNDATSAVRIWIDSVWHRTPLLSPWIRELGYGQATGCDTMDFGVGATTPSTVVATYPYAGQTGVPRSFNGAQEGPTPPVPASGWPSGYPVTLYLKGVSTANQAVMVHTFRVDGTTVDLPHQWITPATSTFGLLSDEYVLYADAPLTALTTYRVHVQGTTSAGTQTFDFTFTTR